MIQPKIYECCKQRRNCPTIEVGEDEVIVGGEEEGYSYWTHQHLYDFILSVREGKFADFEKAMSEKANGDC